MEGITGGLLASYQACSRIKTNEPNWSNLVTCGKFGLISSQEFQKLEYSFREVYELEVKNIYK